ncbi:hypothetical protein V6667_09330 [Neisseria leonii]|uniref:Uncharacterized protein n=1 Tax=Neisseria leonii TaxID=2995413 RepID=A0A9X4E285_9NEIS|nr:hypothetical protein [Neisseria sp. 51.81]MDD9327839.1 hypothetical protein [Neisseria sp. 51.81]
MGSGKTAAELVWQRQSCGAGKLWCFSLSGRLYDFPKPPAAQYGAGMGSARPSGVLQACLGDQCFQTASGIRRKYAVPPTGYSVWPAANGQWVIRGEPFDSRQSVSGMDKRHAFYFVRLSHSFISRFTDTG